MLQRTVVKASNIERNEAAHSPTFASSAVCHQISSLFAVILAAVLMASPSLASSSNAHQNAHARQVSQPRKEFANYRGLYGYRPAVPAISYDLGAPPLQDPRDAFGGYFANPIDNPIQSDNGG